MKKIIAALCLSCALCVPQIKAQGTVTIILEPNTTQPVGEGERKSFTLKDGTRPWISSTTTKPIVGKEYLGDPYFWDAFQTVYDRLLPMLTSSGRIKVLHASKMDRAITEENVYVCSYKLVQGRRTGFKRDGKEEYIIGISLHTWNYLTGESFPALTRTVDIEAFERTQENAFKYAVRFLAFTMLRELSPVTILEKEGSDVSVSAGGEILQAGDILKVRAGLRATIKLRVEETDLSRSICSIVNKAEASSVNVGAHCIFPQPSEEPRWPPTVVIRPVIAAKEIPADIPKSLAGALKTKDLRLRVISLDGVPMEQVTEADFLRHCDYELVCEITRYQQEKETGGTYYDEANKPYNRESVLFGNVTLRSLKTKEMVGNAAIPVRVVCRRFASTGGSAGSVVAWETVAEAAAEEIAKKVHAAVATIPKQ